jgi:hypothetical protein
MVVNSVYNSNKNAELCKLGLAEGKQWHCSTEAGSPGSRSFSKPNITVDDAFLVLFIHSHKSASVRFTAILGGDIVAIPVLLQLGSDPPLQTSRKYISRSTLSTDWE